MIKRQSFQNTRTNNSPLCTLETQESDQPSLLWLPISHSSTDLPLEFQPLSNSLTARSQPPFESFSSSYFQLSLNSRVFLVDCSSLRKVQEQVEKMLRYSEVRENIYHSLKVVILDKIVGRHCRIKPLLIQAMQQYSSQSCKQIDLALSPLPPLHD